MAELLVTGALDALMRSRREGHARVPTPHLDICYQPASSPPIRPNGTHPVGASVASDR